MSAAVGRIPKGGEIAAKLAGTCAARHLYLPQPRKNFIVSFLIAASCPPAPPTTPRIRMIISAAASVV